MARIAHRKASRTLPLPPLLVAGGVLLAGLGYGAFTYAPRLTGPGRVTTAYFAALAGKDEAAARKLLSSGTRLALDQAEQQIRLHCRVPAGTTERFVPLPLQSKHSRQTNVVIAVRTRGDRADVTIRTHTLAMFKGDRALTFPRGVKCLREQGVWRMDFESSVRMSTASALRRLP